MLEQVLLKDLPKEAFTSRMLTELNEFLAGTGAYIDSNPTQEQRSEINATEAPTVDDMYAALHHGSIKNRVGRDEGSQIVWIGPDINPLHQYASRTDLANQQCVLAIIPCVVDTLTIIFQVIGVVAIARPLANALANRIPAAGIIGLQADVNALNAAVTNWAKAKAIAKLGGAILRLIGFKQVIQTLKDNLRWYQWVLMGVIIVAQMVAWFASDGIALAAEIVILSALIAVLVTDIIHAVNVCSSGS